MSLSDFLLMREGWHERRIEVEKYQEAMARRQTFIVAITMGQKAQALEKSWPDPYGAPGKQKKMVNYKGTIMTEYQMQTLIKLKEEKAKSKKK